MSFADREDAEEGRNASSPLRVAGGTGEGRGRSVEVSTKEEPMQPDTGSVLESVLERENLKEAYKRVVKNKGAPGVDGMTVEELGPYLQGNWKEIREQMLTSRYRPQAVRGVEIPKASGGKRLLGIPTVVDRFIQQAIHQVLSRMYEPTFSEGSYGFREGRNTHGAVLQAQKHVGEGYRWVVDMDLEKFFDRVNHDILMSRLGKRVKDKRLLGIIRRYLQAGVLQGGLASPRVEGTPQGGPLSPLLSNILLDELDKELERRGHRFVRYADDCNIYVKSEEAGKRVLESITNWLEKKLKLKVNRDKSGVDRPWKRKFLGYTMTANREPRLKISPKSIERLKESLKEIFRRGRGRKLQKIIEELKPKLRGWIAYYRLTEVRGVLSELDGWIRRRLRVIIWRQLKRVYTRAKALMKRGLAEERAWRSATNQRGPWWNAGASHMNQAYPASYFRELGLVSLEMKLREYQS
jgi:RNA-directed DNA polymerase